jgi:predicted HTH transcriptional regulator
VRYADRIEVKSPGALQNSMTAEKMLAGQRSPRNPLIVDVLRDYGYVDARGMGVRTKIVPLLVKQNGVPPEFEATDDYLLVRMYRGQATQRLSEASGAKAWVRRFAAPVRNKVRPNEKAGVEPAFKCLFRLVGAGGIEPPTPAV